MLRVNGDFLGCVVEPGKETVMLEFHPASLRRGWLVSLARTGADRDFPGLRPGEFPAALAGGRRPMSYDDLCRAAGARRNARQRGFARLQRGPRAAGIIAARGRRRWRPARPTTRSSSSTTAPATRARECSNQLAAADRRVGVVHLSRNFGHQAAVQAGLAHSRGDAVVLMDSDLQDAPEAIGEFLAKWRAGYDVVYAIRTERKENLLKRLLFAAFHWLMSRVATVPIPADAGIFGLIDRRVARQIIALAENDRYFPGLRGWVGFRQTGIVVAAQRPLRPTAARVARRPVPAGQDGHVFLLDAAACRSST